MNSNLYFKGGRDYLHSTTLMDYIVRQVVPKNDELKNIDFSLARFTDKVCEVFTEDQFHGCENEILGQFRYGDLKLLIIETTEKITKHVEYDEVKLIDQCNLLKENRISIPGDVGHFSFIEKVVAAYKELLQYKFGKIYHSFFFIRLTLDKIPQGSIDITYNRMISKKYFQATISQRGHKLGMLFFGAKK